MCMYVHIVYCQYFCLFIIMAACNMYEVYLILLQGDESAVVTAAPLADSNDKVISYLDYVQLWIQLIDYKKLKVKKSLSLSLASPFIILSGNGDGL